MRRRMVRFPQAVMPLLCVAAPLRAQTPQPVCVPRIPAAVTMTIDGATAGDWSLFTPQVITYDGTAADTTRLAADATHLYFLTTVRAGNFLEFGAQSFTIGVNNTLAGPHRMLRVTPFSSAPPPSGFDDNSFADGAFANNTFGGTWDDSWPVGALLNTDFWRFFLTSGPTPHWRLEGRITLANLNITSADNFNLFLHISAGSAGAEKKYWPGPAPADLGDPATATFGQNRCPDIEFSDPYLAFGKKPFPSSNPLSVTISNTGAAGSLLAFAPGAASLTGDASFGSLTLLKGVTPPPFTLSTAETATLSVTYTPSGTTTMASPHTATVSIASNDPDENPATLPAEGLARGTMDLLFILDQSGSMLSQNKWTTTKWATEVGFEVARLFRIPQDRAGAVWFGGPSNNPQSGVLRALNTYPATPGSFTAMFSQEAQNSFYTPIGLGLTQAHNTFLAPGNQANVALLMSDGIHNRPVATSGATTVAGLSLPAAVSGNTKSMQVTTVALGTDAGVSTTLLDAIKSHYAPAAAPTTYNITSQPEALAAVFGESLAEYVFANRVDLDAAVGGYPIPQDAHSVLAMIAWIPPNVPQDIQVRVFDAAGVALQTTFTSATTGYHKGGGTTQPFTYVLITDPAQFAENRVWKITDGAGGAISDAIGVPIVFEDLNIIAHAAAEQPAPGTGSDYVLQVRLREVGRPITNMPGHPVQVTAHVARPGEGLGHLASTVSLQTCLSSDPILPPAPRSLQVMRGDIASIPARRQAVVVPGQDTGQVDPQTYLFAWATAYIAACSPNELQRIQEPGITLTDDGTGLYTHRFTATDYEGSYVVRFSAIGTTPTGARFARTRTLSTYVPVGVDPAASGFDRRVFAQVGGATVWEFHVTPRDRFRRYMGPGKRDRVRFTVVGGSGTVLGDVHDYNNGIYSVLVRQEPGQPIPVMDVVVDGTRIRPPRDGLRRPFELGTFAGRTFFDSTMALNDGLLVGGRLGFRAAPALVIEAEGAATFTEDVAGNSGRVLQALGNVRLDLSPGGPAVPFVRVGAGMVLFRGFGLDDEALAVHGGGGLSLWLSPSFGLRGDARVLRVEDVFGLGRTTNYQAAVGLVLRF